MSRALVCGWPSLEGGEATAGDLLAMEVVTGVLAGAGIDVDVATNEAFPGGTDLRTARADLYSFVLFVCGPLHGERVRWLARRFRDSRLIAVGVSVVDPRVAALFDVVIARDRIVDGLDGAPELHPDLSFLRKVADVPVIGVVRAHDQPEYGRTDHQRVHELVRAALATRNCATVDFDTRVHPCADPFEAHARSSEAVCALAARMDVVFSTRLHGAVLSLAQGVPVVAVDPVRGGAKVSAQMSAIGWPCSFTAEDVSIERLVEAVEWCLTPGARRTARSVADGAVADLGPMRDALLAAIDARASGASG